MQFRQDTPASRGRYHNPAERLRPILFFLSRTHTCNCNRESIIGTLLIIIRIQFFHVPIICLLVVIPITFQ